VWETGVDVQSNDNRGWIPPSHASKNNYLKAVKRVEEASANVGLKGKDGKTALDLMRKRAKQR